MEPTRLFANVNSPRLSGNQVGRFGESNILACKKKICYFLLQVFRTGGSQRCDVQKIR